MNPPYLHGYAFVALIHMCEAVSCQETHDRRPVGLGFTGRGAKEDISERVLRRSQLVVSAAIAVVVTKHANGTITLAVYRKSGIAGANARLAQLGDDHVVVVPVEVGCPALNSLPPPPVSPYSIDMGDIAYVDGSVTVKGP